MKTLFGGEIYSISTVVTGVLRIKTTTLREDRIHERKEEWIGLIWVLNPVYSFWMMRINTSSLRWKRMCRKDRFD